MKYCPEIVEQLCQSIRDMKGRVGACKEAGISYQCFLNWMDGILPAEAFETCLNEEDKGRVKFEFVESIKKAEKDCENIGEDIAVMAIFKAMPTNWQAAAWWLERTKKPKYNPPTVKQEIEHDIANRLLPAIKAADEVIKRHAAERSAQDAPSNAA